MKKLFFTGTSIGLLSLFIAVLPASAHVIVKPNEVGIGAFQTFTMGVPNEKDTPTTELRLLIPDGLKSVTPNVKDGWTIDVKKTGEGEDAKVTEIDWTGGSIPAGERDDFNFNAQVPSTVTTLKWKAYQTYGSGEIVEWIHDPSKNPEDDSAPPPYSTTKVINDLTDDTVKPANQASTSDTINTLFSTIALALSVVAISLQLRKK